MDIHSLTIRFGCLLSLGVIAGGEVALAANYYVAPWGDDSKDGLSWETAMKSPEAVVVDRWNNTTGHTLTISNGTYKLTRRMACTGGWDGGFKIKSLTGNPEHVILDGQGVCGGIYLSSSYDSVIEGLTVTNCVVTGSDGAGIYLHDTNGQIKNCIVRDCHVKANTTSERHGGGVCTSWCTISGTQVESCSIESEEGVSGCSAKGGGIYAFRGIVTNCVVRSCAIRLNSGECYPNGGGICAVNGGSAYADAGFLPSVFDTEIVNCEVSLPYRYGGAGAGMFVSCDAPDGVSGQQYQALVSNCLISGCTNWNSGPLTLGGHVDVVNTTVTNCFDKADYCEDTHSTGICMTGSRNHVRGCLVAGNVGMVGGYGGGTPAVIMSTESSLVDSAIVANTGATRIALQLASNVLVSNCIFRANVQTMAAQGGLIYSGDLAVDTNAEIVDCYFVDNDCAKCTWGGWIWFDNAKEHAYEVRFRNCLCANNKLGGGGALIYSNGNAEKNSKLCAVFENCTIVNNTMSSTYYSVMHGYDEGDPTWVSAYRMFLHGCIIVGNTGAQGQVYGRIFSATNNTNYSVFKPNDYQSFHPDSVGNKIYDPALPLFVDADGKDYRMTQGSQACDMVPASPWMGTGRKNGPQDLGSGCEVVAVEDHGVTISRLNASRRLSGDCADAGCTELYRPLGMSVIVR